MSSSTCRTIGIVAVATATALSVAESPAAKTDLTYIRFLPQTNFFHDFPAGNRPAYVSSKMTGKIEVEKILAAFQKHGKSTTMENPETAFIRIAAVDESQFFQSSYAGLPASFRQLCPDSFIVLLPDAKNPAIWIGGSSAEGLIKAVEFCSEIVPVLKSKYLAAGDFHVHSLISDGWAQPEDLVPLALNARLDIIAITDHNRDTGFKRLVESAKGTENLVTLKGMELNDSRNNHILTIGNAAGLSQKEPEQIIAAAKAGKVIIAQAHATSTKYFGPLNQPYYIGAEAFNYLSSAPETAREYLRNCFRQGKRALALGNSDAHMTADIGKARTYLLLDNFSEAAVMAEMRECRTCAFYAGQTVGDPELEWLITRIHNNSDLLEGKLVPPPAIWQRPLQNELKHHASDTGTELKELETRRENRRKIYCPTVLDCDCLEHYFKLPADRTGSKLVSGRAENVIMEINGIRKPVLLQTGEGVSLRQFLFNGENSLKFDSLPVKPESPRLCLGRELLNWELQRNPQDKFFTVTAASNLQIQNLAPKGGFKGEFTYRMKVDNPEHCDRLFFESIDGNIHLYINGKLLARRYGTHWEERFEVLLPPELSKMPQLEIIIKINKQVGLSGVSNRTFIGVSIPLTAGNEYKFKTPTLPELADIRWGEQRTRGFLLDNNFKILNCFFNDGMPVTMPENAKWLMLTSFNPVDKPVIINKID